MSTSQAARTVQLNNHKMTSPSAEFDHEKTIGVSQDFSGLKDNAQPEFEENDMAAAIVGEHAHAIDPAIEKRVLRKIDWYLIPAMSVGYGLVYYDKV
jgi:hypothetical protein